MFSLDTLKNTQFFGHTLMVGFQGTTIKDEEVQKLLKAAQEEKIGGIIFFRHNFLERQQIFDLVGAFASLSLDVPLLLAIDQEGGSGDFGEKGVQRLWSGNGFRDFPTAQSVRETCSPSEASIVYSQMAHDIKSTGLNVVLGPVVDLFYEESAAIGRLKRSYSCDPLEVVQYAQAFIDACHAKGLITCLKHFPGHGLAQKDSHKGCVDITDTFSSQELEPFIALVEKGYKDMIMTAHVMHRDYDPLYPATLSSILLEKWMPSTFSGLVISDDMMMAAIQDHFTLEKSIVLALTGGVDMVILSRNPQAYQGKSVETLNPHRSTENSSKAFENDYARTLLANKSKKVRAFKLKYL